MNIVHIAIPTHDLEAATQFYTALGAMPARRYDDRQTFRWFEHQLVCHLCAEEVRFTGAPLQHAYPRHFGMTFEREDDFDAAVALCAAVQATMMPVSIRFAGRPEHHKTVFVADPSENIIEFKWYFDSHYAY